MISFHPCETNCNTERQLKLICDSSSIQFALSPQYHLIPLHSFTLVRFKQTIRKRSNSRSHSLHRPSPSSHYNQFLSLFILFTLAINNKPARQTSIQFPLRSFIVHFVKHINHQFLFLRKHVVVLFYSPFHSSFLPFSGSSEPINSTRACRLLTSIIPL